MTYHSFIVVSADKMLACGNPVTLAALQVTCSCCCVRKDVTTTGLVVSAQSPIHMHLPQAGEYVLDLGCGAGLDCILASKQVQTCLCYCNYIHLVCAGFFFWGGGFKNIAILLVLLYKRLTVTYCNSKSCYSLLEPIK